MCGRATLVLYIFRIPFKVNYFIEISMVHDSNLFKNSRTTFYGHMVMDGLRATWEMKRDRERERIAQMIRLH